MADPLANFRTLLSACPTWQALCSATGTEEQKRATAAAKVFFYETTDTAFPVILIDEPTSDANQVGAVSTFGYSGTINFDVIFEKSTSAKSSQQVTLRGSVRDLRDEMIARAGTFESGEDYSFIDLKNVTIGDLEESPIEDTETSCWRFRGTAEWGV